MTAYFKVTPKRAEYIGSKYFAMAADSDTVLQVCAHPGPDVRRGRTNAVGIYTITRTSFATNYMAMGYVEPITEKQYKKVFDTMIESLSNIFKK